MKSHSRLRKFQFSSTVSRLLIDIFKRAYILKAAWTMERHGNLSIHGLAKISLRFIDIDFPPRKYFYSRRNDAC